jgi:hypothetical protein
MKDSLLIILAAATLAVTTTSPTFDLALNNTLIAGNLNPGGGGAAMQLVVPVTSYAAPVTLAITGSPTGGTFTITVQNSGGTFTTTALAYNASAATVQAALVALTNVGANVTVTLSGSTYTINFAATLGIVTTTASGASLTGGSSPAATPSTPTYSFQINTSPDGVNWTQASRLATVLTDSIPSTGYVMQVDFAAPGRYVQLVATLAGTGASIVLGDCYLSPTTGRFG